MWSSSFSKEPTESNTPNKKCKLGRKLLLFRSEQTKPKPNIKQLSNRVHLLHRSSVELSCILSNHFAFGLLSARSLLGIFYRESVPHYLISENKKYYRSSSVGRLCSIFTLKTAKQTNLAAKRWWPLDANATATHFRHHRRHYWRCCWSNGVHPSHRIRGFFETNAMNG